MRVEFDATPVWMTMAGLDKILPPHHTINAP
jgi:hypothetical protein